MGSYKTTGAVLLCSSVMALGIPIFETLISIARRYLGGFPLFGADSHHTHHRLLRRGLTQRQAAVFLYAAALSCMVAAILGNVISMESVESLVPVAIMLFTLGGIIAVAGYTKSIMNKYGFRRDTMRFMALSRYAAMTLESESSVREVQRVLDLVVCELGLLALEVRFDRGHGSICSTEASRDPGARLDAGETTRFALKAADGSPLEISFQYAGQPGPLRHHTISACLASIFDGLDMRIEREPESFTAQASLVFPPQESKILRPTLVGRAAGR
jgi:hypothetical protein